MVRPDASATQHKIQEFLRRKENGTLAISKTQAAIASYMQPVSLSSNTEGILRYGQVVIVRHAASGAALAALNSMYATPRDDGNTPVSAAPDATSTVRTAFTIVAHDSVKAAPGDAVTYGARFHLRHTGISQRIYTRICSQYSRLHAHM